MRAHRGILETLVGERARVLLGPLRDRRAAEDAETGRDLLDGEQPTEEAQCRRLVAAHRQIDDARPVPRAIERLGAVQRVRVELRLQ